MNIFGLNLAWKPCCSFSTFSIVHAHHDFSNVFKNILTHHILNFNQGVNLWFHGLILQEVSNINWHFKRWCKLTSLSEDWRIGGLRIEDWRFLFPFGGVGGGSFLPLNRKGPKSTLYARAFMILLSHWREWGIGFFSLSVFLCLDCFSLALGERTWGACVTGSLLADLM